jgi:hypothetical protein
MKTKKMILGLALGLLSSLSYGRGGVGNGGGGQVCKNSEGVITEVRMYDLYEGYIRYNIDTTNKEIGNISTFLKKALKKIAHINPTLSYEIGQQVKYLREDGHFLIRPKIILEKVPDANILVIEEGCSYEQLANWDEVSGNVMVKKEYFDLMSPFDQAALYVHEAIYKVGRNRLHLDKSDWVRRIVAEVMSESAPVTQLLGWAQQFDVLPDNETVPKIEINKTANGVFALKLHLGEIEYNKLKEKIRIVVKISSKEVNTFRSAYADQLAFLEPIHFLREKKDVGFSCDFDFPSNSSAEKFKCMKDRKEEYKKFVEFQKTYPKVVSFYDVHFNLPSTFSILPNGHSSTMISGDFGNTRVFADFTYSMKATVLLDDQILAENEVSGNIIDLIVTNTYDSGTLKITSQIYQTVNE